MTVLTRELRTKSDREQQDTAALTTGQHRYELRPRHSIRPRRCLSPEVKRGTESAHRGAGRRVGELNQTVRGENRTHEERIKNLEQDVSRVLQQVAESDPQDKCIATLEKEIAERAQTSDRDNLNFVIAQLNALRAARAEYDYLPMFPLLIFDTGQTKNGEQFQQPGFTLPQGQ
ncbi:hypothetical protein ACLOJK_008816 [Asimina triloba]